MMCYRDKEFCTHEICADFESCPDALTPRIKIEADLWWGSKGAPICIHEEKTKPECFKEKS
jgi:hypothetical protein